MRTGFGRGPNSLTPGSGVGLVTCGWQHLALVPGVACEGLGKQRCSLAFTRRPALLKGMGPSHLWMHPGDKSAVLPGLVEPLESCKCPCFSGMPSSFPAVLESALH